MAAKAPETSDRSQQRQTAISRWDYEGGAGPCGPQEGSDFQVGPKNDVPLSNTELVQLRIRVIALENLLVALLADASDQQLTRIRDMATFIAPRPGSTPHALTINAATQMVSLITRADHFKNLKPTSNT
jgi:hypothetical protein